MNDTKILLVRIKGRVQGVWYRNWTFEQARVRELDGWVRNRSDRSVEALFSGSSKNIESMLQACHTGPLLARVTAVLSEPVNIPVAKGFQILPTL